MRASELVRDIRRTAGLSQRELAARARTSGPTVAAYEAGTKEPRLSTLERLARAVGLTLSTTIELSPAEAARARRRDRSLALAAATSHRVALDWDRAVALARENLDTMDTVVGTNASRQWLDEWRALLRSGPGAVRAALVDRSPGADDLRQMHPFAGLLTDSERELVLVAADEVTIRG